MHVPGSGITQTSRRRKEESFAAYEVILSASATFLGEIPFCQLLAKGVDPRCCGHYLLRHLLPTNNYDCTPSGRCLWSHCGISINFHNAHLLHQVPQQEWNINWFFSFLFQCLLEWFWGWCFSLLKRWKSAKRKMAESARLLTGLII